jgi:Phospholipase D-like domain at C-terminus of MIT
LADGGADRWDRTGYLIGAEEITIEDPYIRTQHQIVNFLRFCETAVRIAKPKRIVLVTKFDSNQEKDEAMARRCQVGSCDPGQVLNRFVTITERLFG